MFPSIVVSGGVHSKNLRKGDGKCLRASGAISTLSSTRYLSTEYTHYLIPHGMKNHVNFRHRNLARTSPSYLRQREL